MSVTATPARAQSLHVIQSEHRALSAMLSSMTLLVGQWRRKGTSPDFDLLRSMVFYLDEFPERLHHTHETRYLFPALRGREPDLDQVLDRLDHEHAEGERAVRGLEHALLAWEVMGDVRRDGFEHALQRFSQFYHAHMGLEEEVVLPAARRLLADEDWADMDAAFVAHHDPLAGGRVPDAVYEALFSRILNVTPAPLGLGPAV